MEDEKNLDTQKLNQALEDLDRVFQCLEQSLPAGELCEVCTELGGDFGERPILEICVKARKAGQSSEPTPPAEIDKTEIKNENDGETGDEA